MGLFKKKKKEAHLLAFATGEVVALKDVKDQMFSAGLMGQGIAIKSEDGKFCSLVNGTVTMLFPTKHALGLKSEDGQELLLHIGIDTVGLKGEGFSAFVQDGAVDKPYPIFELRDKIEEKTGWEGYADTDRR